MEVYYLISYVSLTVSGASTHHWPSHRSHASTCSSSWSRHKVIGKSNRAITCAWQIKQLPQKVGLASAISWYFLSHQLWNILGKHCLLTYHGQWHHAGGVLQEPNLYDLFPWRRNCGSVFSWWVWCHYIYQTQAFRRCRGHENLLFYL